MIPSAVVVENVAFRYGDVEALRGVSFEVPQGSVFALLGPNGGGKTTLFRILSTLLKPDSGRTLLFDIDVAENPHEARRRIGVVFQSQSLDRRLSANENLLHQGHLYGIRGAELKSLTADLLALVGMTDQAGRRIEQMSGGQRRRVELAKSLLHGPELLLLDEPSTGIDPAGRIEFWSYLERLRRERQVTILLTTHLLDEADRCDRLAILDSGNLVAEGSPGALKELVGGDVISFTCDDQQALIEKLRSDHDISARVVEGQVRFEHARAMDLLATLTTQYSAEIDSAKVSHPSLEDVFIHMTGRRMDHGLPSGDGR